jgi:hypothetical protein
MSAQIIAFPLRPTRERPTEEDIAEVTQCFIAAGMRRVTPAFARAAWELLIAPLNRRRSDNEPPPMAS